MNTQEWIALMFALIGYLYYPILNRRPSRPVFRHALDDRIPLLPFFIYPYIAFHPLKIISIFTLMHTPWLLPYLVSTAVVGWTCACIWYLFPNGVQRPVYPIEGTQGITQKILIFVHTSDGDSNGLPSAHVAYACCMGFWLSIAFPQYALLIIFTCILVAVSTLLTKQHYILDFPSGVLVGILGVLLGSFGTGM